MEIVQSKTNIGLIRKNNEDVALSMKHPKDKRIVLLLVADGMGGKEYGDVASSYVSLKIEKWFKSRSLSTLNNINKCEEQLRVLIEKANDELIEKYGSNVLGTTLSLALINKEETLILNIGDSRIYVYRNKKLIQVTEDDSDVWFYYKYGAVRKDDLRYFYNNNIITACVGISDSLCRINSNILDNTYDLILLLTDGVTDLITDRKIRRIIESNSSDKVLGCIIDEAVNKDQHLHIPLRLKKKKYSKYILPFHGRDNASGAIYIARNLKK